MATRLDELVPLQIQRAGVVGLELEPAALEPDDFAGDPIAVGEGHDVGAALGMSWRAQKHERSAMASAARENAPQVRDRSCSAMMTCPGQATLAPPTRSTPGRDVARQLFGLAAAYGLPPSAFEMSAIARCARTLLPASSSGGDTTAMPNLPGDTAMMPPPTPLLAGRPV